MCICRIIFLTGASNNHNNSFPFFLSFGGGGGCMMSGFEKKFTVRYHRQPFEIVPDL